MRFMQPQVYEGMFFEIDTSAGTEVVPADVVGRFCLTPASVFTDYLEGKPLDPDEEVELKHGWLARMSAPGYTDCTEYSAFTTEYEAWAFLVETFMDDTHIMLGVPSHFLSALVNGDTTGFELADEREYGDFIANNPEALRVETVFHDAHYFDGYQDVTPCICRIKEQP